MTQTQLREKAREMFDERFVEMHPMNGQDLYNPPILYQVPPEDIEDFKNFIDEIITLALEEKVKEVEKLKIQIIGKAAEIHNVAIDRVIEILKQ